MFAWLPAAHTLKPHKDHLTIGPSLQYLHTINKNLKLTSYPGPLSPTKHNPDFKPGPPPQIS